MGGLYSKMKSGGNSYGVVPGNGGPRADDKNMNAGPGHVVPAHNTHIAKKVVKALGYEPDVKVDMNQGKKFHGENQSVPIKISSKEYFLNDEQVARMKSELNIDPETLSPDSDYNQRVDGGTTKQVNNMVDKKIGLYGLMNNNNNQYPAYQNGGGTGAHGGYPMEFMKALHQETYGDLSPTQETLRGANRMAQKEWPGYLSGTGGYGHVEMSPDVMSQWNRETGNPVGYEPPAPMTNIEQANVGHYGQDNMGDIDWASIPAFENQAYRTSVESQLNSGNWGLDASDPNNPMTYRLGSEYDPNAPAPSLPTLPAQQIPNPGASIENRVPLDMEGNPINTMETAEGINLPSGANPEGEVVSPYDQALNDQLQRSQDLTDSEKAAQVGMGLWNLSRDYQQLPEPVYMNPSLITRDYEGMKNEAIGDVNRNDRKAMYQARQLGIDATQLTGITANTQEGTTKINKSIFEMQKGDIAHNVQAENIAKDKYAQMKFSRDMTNAQSEAAFADAKGKNIAQNVSEYHDAEEAGLYRDSGLVGAKANREMEADFNEYRSLNKNKIAADRKRILNSDWNKMSREEKDQLLKIYGS